MAKSESRTFEAMLERTGDRRNWTIVHIPFDVAKVWGKRGRLRVKGQMNGFAFRTSLVPTGKGNYVLMVNRKMQVGGKVVPDAKAKFRLEPDTAPREVNPPAELLRMLRQSKALQRFFDSLNYSRRYQIAVWVGEGKQPETRQRRAEQIAERLLATMEGERELPPVLQIALRNNPKAKAGWELMPHSHRRSHLLGIFYYRNPESRSHRVAKAVEEMVAYAEKRAAKRRTERAE